ncbi:MAG: hypothetical protein HYV42_05895 [Candidatus Magasanikbacteria bacterium]|nr:hypothetical protein [Candidatus Magasanikbacteria bacterium]
MKYRELITLENLFSAWDAFKIGKQKKPDVLLFERNLEDNIFKLYEELSTKTYEHQAYRTFHLYDPKFRIINKASVRDRVVHHLIFKFLEPLYQPAFIRQSYSCQPGKGIHLAINDLARTLRKVSSNYTRRVWALKLDIRKFFDSIDHDVLFQLVKKKVTDPDILHLLDKIIRSFCSTQGPGRGVPIGNLTSQIFSNMYLSELDYFVKFNLKERHYFRYADDFLFLHYSAAHLQAVQDSVGRFLKESLRLTIHPNKIILRTLQQGIDFVGYVELPQHRVLRTSTKHRMFTKMKQKVRSYNDGKSDEEELGQTLQSYLGVLKHCSGYDIEQRLLHEVWLRKEQAILFQNHATA